MELGSILQFLENRAILVTGATGFIAKIFIEKILRVQPNIKKLYLLLRASDTDSAILRFNNEIIGKELFEVLKEKYGENLNLLISEKVRMVGGDISCENLGVKDSSLLDEMLTQVDVVLNLAATTNFDERYDISFEINTMGARNVLNFSKQCNKLKVFVHVSTAYVSGEKEGLILETSYKMGETLNGASGLDIDAEKQLIMETLKQLNEQKVPEDSIKSSMKDLGIQRARKFGWPNTYVFTKAMGEMILGEYKDNIPLVIIRPTIVTSTYKDPFPGWIEGVRTIDSIIVGYGKGRINYFLGNPMTILDLKTVNFPKMPHDSHVIAENEDLRLLLLTCSAGLLLIGLQNTRHYILIPADMVVNAIIVAMAAHANQTNETIIYHVGSSVSHPIEFTCVQDYLLGYFTKHPWINRHGKPVLVESMRILSTLESFQRYMMIRYFLPLKGLEIVNTACCQYLQKLYVEKSRKYKFVMRLADLYAPYLFFKAAFDDMNTEKLRRAAEESGVDTEMFYFDPKNIDWEDYFITTHIPGVVKHVF